MEDKRAGIQGRGNPLRSTVMTLPHRYRSGPGTCVTVREGGFHDPSARRHIPDKLKWPSSRTRDGGFLCLRKPDPFRGDRQYADEAPRPEE